jgi:hypothetical protein
VLTWTNRKVPRGTLVLSWANEKAPCGIMIVAAFLNLCSFVSKLYPKKLVIKSQPLINSFNLSYLL